jgi:hypothetical protein
MKNLKTNPCTNCADEVPARRRSESGKHWCQRPKCQSAKQRYYRKRVKAEADQTVAQVRAQLVYDLAHKERTNCAHCGLGDALPGWAHRDETGTKACVNLGSAGREVPELLDQIHPGRAELAVRNR